MQDTMQGENMKNFMKQWQAGDEQAFGAVLDYYFPRLLASSIQMVHSKEDSEELAMNVMLKLWQHKHRLTDVLKIDDYIFGILRQEIAARARKRVLNKVSIDQIDVQELGMVQHPELTLQELQKRYYSALDKLTDRQKEIFLFSREQELSQQEIANKMGLSVHTVNNHMTAALKVIREEMKECPQTLLIFVLASPHTAMLFC